MNPPDNLPPLPPAVSAGQHADDLREFIEAVREPASGEPTGVEDRVCGWALRAVKRIAAIHEERWDGVMENLAASIIQEESRNAGLLPQPPEGGPDKP